MRALLDVNVLLAAFDTGHIRHVDTMRWWREHADSGWASCPLTENGYLRIVSQASYPRSVRLPEAMAVLRRQIAEGRHEFWPDDLSVLDTRSINHAHLLGAKQITDIYLLALAMKRGGRLVTLDRGISHAAARGATPANLVTL